MTVLVLGPLLVCHVTSAVIEPAPGYWLVVRSSQPSRARRQTVKLC